ncbi:uncharacterized protein BYT42DRAFT_567075 [Radiomyces spectabilis]|uniref:uncharacterized protein n=1 Tax=Radiomyces spectabilis TaxID=64574 RepID=UPI00221FB990|nr:uncharacterized protein BYT42DRAFT_567075 [Radiomyces spectabilis]KAI8381587.1 hypothetical protein BYT42DRAFT_567075 [Radiomyces spectabilis]
MHSSIRPGRDTHNDDDDLEAMQREFFAKKQTPSASVQRVQRAPEFVAKKKLSVFAQRRRDAAAAANAAGTLTAETAAPASNVTSDVSEPSKPSVIDEVDEETPNMPSLESASDFEPVPDPFDEPHVPVSKKMLDLTSLLGNVLGQVTEHTVDTVTAPSLPQPSGSASSHYHTQGFPEPAHRSTYREKEQHQETATDFQSNHSMKDYEEENWNRIASMSPAEIEAARQEILGTLSASSIAMLMGRNKSSGAQSSVEETSSVADHTIETDVAATTSNPSVKKNAPRGTVAQTQLSTDSTDDDLLLMKEKFFADVPLEADKVAWMEPRFMEVALQHQQKEGKTDDAESKKVEDQPSNDLYRRARFDLQGDYVDPNADIPHHQGLHHHGDEADKAGYTLAELFYLVRSQVPAQRAMVLTTIARILETAKSPEHRKDPFWMDVLALFSRADIAASVYLRSALDDKNLVVLVSAVHAMAALLLESQDTDSTLSEVEAFNKYLGHLRRVTTRKSSRDRKGLAEKLSITVDRINRTDMGEADELGEMAVAETEGETTVESDAELARRDLRRGLIKMDILPRIRFLMQPTSKLRNSDPVSMERLIRILVCLAEGGDDVCNLIAEHDLVDLVMDWGLFKKEWPMTEDAASTIMYPSVHVLCLLTILVQSNKKIATDHILPKMDPLVQLFLVTSPEIACPTMQRRAYSLQLETLKLMRVLLCYGLILPTLQDLQDPVMEWFRAALKTDDPFVTARAATVLGVLEILLHAGGDPHKTTPAHAVDWHQATAFFPAVMALWRSTHSASVAEGALAYIAAWTTYIDKFRPSVELLQDVWRVLQGRTLDDHPRTSNGAVRYLQLLAALAQLKHTAYAPIAEEAKKKLKSSDVVEYVKQVHVDDVQGRMTFWIWMNAVADVDVREHAWGGGYKQAELETTVSSVHAGAPETWLAQMFVQRCVLNRLGAAVPTLGLFYLGDHDPTTSKALFEYDGRHCSTMMFPSLNENDSERNHPPTTLTAWVFGPIDEMYHFDKSTSAQKSDAVAVVCDTLEAAWELLDKDELLDHDMAVVSLMKIFLIGDREGRTPWLETDREIFWHDKVTVWIDRWLDRLCEEHTTVGSLEAAWRRSSDYIRQVHVPFFQFYQAFVAQYASVSLGQPGFARLLAYIAMELDAVDYKHLLFSDYGDVIRTIRIVNTEQETTQQQPKTEDAQNSQHHRMQMRWNNFIRNVIQR